MRPFQLSAQLKHKEEQNPIKLNSRLTTDVKNVSVRIKWESVGFADHLEDKFSFVWVTQKQFDKGHKRRFRNLQRLNGGITRGEAARWFTAKPHELNKTECGRQTEQDVTCQAMAMRQSERVSKKKKKILPEGRACEAVTPFTKWHDSSPSDLTSSYGATEGKIPKVQRIHSFMQHGLVSPANVSESAGDVRCDGWEISQPERLEIVRLPALCGWICPILIRIFNAVSYMIYFWLSTDRKRK